MAGQEDQDLDYAKRGITPEQIEKEMSRPQHSSNIIIESNK
jgi:hypothetical protein